MRLETFFEKFDQFADAPGAVARMRDLVLELAIQGKLVAQCDDEEPALKQLERIIAKKAKNGRVGRVKTRKSGSSSAEEAETHVPIGWEKTSLAELVTVLNGRAYSKDELLAAGMPVLRVGNLFTSKNWYYSDLQLEPDKYCDNGDLIFAWSASFGPFIWPGPKVIYHYHIWKLELHSEADLHKGYLYWFLQNKTQEIKRAGHGVSMLHMTKEKMEKLEVMLPPLAEQKRIVAKVDELMALCDRLEAQQQERETRHAALGRASLARFADAPTPTNLPFLFHPSYAIPPADLRRSILTLAVQGKLVPQDPNDEPAKELAERIRFERLRLAKTGKAGKATDFAPIAESAQPYDVPESWAWVPLGNITFIRTGKLDANASSPDGKYPFFTCAKDPLRIDRYAYDGECILLAGNGNFDVNFYDGKFEAYQRTYIIEGVSRETVDGQYLFRFIQKYADTLREMSVGGVISYIKIGFLTDAPLPLPPLAEQRRIVAKVDQLMTLVDELETQLATAHDVGSQLIDAVVAELTQGRALAGAGIPLHRFNVTRLPNEEDLHRLIPAEGSAMG